MTKEEAIKFLIDLGKQTKGGAFVMSDDFMKARELLGDAESSRIFKEAERQ